jgi:hypothetical protein
MCKKVRYFQLLPKLHLSILFKLFSTVYWLLFRVKNSSQPRDFMDARNTASHKHKFQPIPKDFLKLVQDTFQEKYTDYLKDKTLIIDGAIFPEEIVIIVGFKNKNDKIRQQNFECSMDYTNDEYNDVLEKIHLSIDALDAMVAEYVEANGDIEMPTQWTDFDFEDKKVYLKSSTDNIELEKMADEFLALHEAENQGQQIH